MKKGYKQLIEELEDSLQAYTNYRTRAEEIIQGNLATINDLMLKLKKKEEDLAKVALDCSAKQVYKIKDLQSLLGEMFIREIVKEARKPKRVPAKTGTFGDDLDGKMIYQHKTEDEIVEMFIDRISKGDNELKTIIEDIANGAK